MLKRSSRQTRAADGRALKVALLSAVFTVGGVTEALAHGETISTAPPQLNSALAPDPAPGGSTPLAPVAPTPVATAAAPLKLAQANTPTASRAPINTTGRTINLTVPAKDGAYDMGDMPMAIDANDTITFPAQRTLDLLSKILDQNTLQALKTNFNGQATITPAAFNGTGIAVAYDPKRLELVFLIPANMRAARSVSIAALDARRLGTVMKPADFSGYLNVRGNLDYIGAGSSGGLQDPVFALDGALNLRGIVLESAGVWQPGMANTFQRTGTRLLYDDTKDLIRFTVGDLQPVSEGFQATPDMFGVSIFRSYGVLEPEFVARPRGDQVFTLTRASTVEVYVNGQMVRRLQLNAGNYNARDFPFTQGANNVLLNIIDDTGARQTLRFNTFFDQTQLQPGLSEFGLYVGVMAPLGMDGPVYGHDWTYSGFYRAGVSKDLTLGFNMQGDEFDTQAGVDGVWGSPIGSFSWNAAVSRIANIGSGSAANVTFQRLFQLGGNKASSFNLFFETRSRDFGSLTVLTPSNQYAWEVGGSYTQAITADYYAGLDLRFNKGRDGARDVNSYRATMGWRITPSLGLTLDAIYDDTDISNHKNFSVVMSLTKRMTPWSSLRVDYDSKEERSTVTYQDQHGQGVGSYNLTADVEHTPSSTGFNGNFTYEGNRGEVGLTSFSTFDSGFGSTTDSRTSLRFASSFAFADGAVSMGRPIYDAFAIVKPHETLGNADVVIQPTTFGYDAETGHFGTAIENSLTAYANRVVTVEVPNAPAGYDIGKGAYHLFPPHRGGYLLEVGSAYSVTAIGRLVDQDGKPISLLAGKAYEVAAPDRPPVEIFTNREGRFGAPGLRPGKWRIVMPTEPESTFILEVPAHTLGAMRAGELKPTTNTGS
ncbi:MAG TPA: fimbrial biogenesis outer membrane usher protein [Caulobacteraceae bacterium]|jgi:outer membrane usher protein|nr:fimbrial biogenesis outer membrane usher protein [Caulobacteraceae bacterium]